MASFGTHNNNIDIEAKPSKIKGAEENNSIDYFQRAQWLRAAVLGANDGLVSVTSLMMGVGAVNEDSTTMLLAGFAGLIAGACSMGIGEFVSVYTQLDIMVAQIKREREISGIISSLKKGCEDEKLPNPFQAAIASAIAFSLGASVPMIGAAFIRDYKIRLVVVAVLSSLALLVFGGVGAILGKAPVRLSCVRVLIGGWMAMAITFGLTKLIGYSSL
ncbi:vacuolar iron transporter homolog 4-like [Cicer arietinum]|uniref:Vacuolar iron transporter n=1 Tax=Cicer arietinum TaxID=3827 RepID=A0A1S2YH63_CICAR|nr:vacuolar iron transporter homolog 4-like [Cicer arietinum]